MEDQVDQSSFASILAGVQQMRDSYDTEVIGNDTENTQIGESVYGEEKQANVTGNLDPENGKRPEAAEKATKNEAHKKQTPKTPAAGVARSSALPQSRRGPRNVHSYTSVQVAPSQKGNPLLEAPQMKLTSWEYNAQILSDYYINATLQVLFLSLKYHKLRPEYVWRRLDKLKGGNSSTNYNKDDDALRVLLVVVDIDSPQETLRKLSVMCIKNDMSMVVAWSFEEAGNYVAAFKANEMARARVNVSIQGVKKTDFNSNIVNCLTTVRAVNKTDVANLLANCKSFRNVVASSAGDGLSAISGLGGRKVANLKDAFHEPFIFNKSYGSG